MARADELLEAMHEAARSNRREVFDELEAEFLDLYPGGFQGMPAEVYDQYLEVDRQWPIIVGERDGAGPAPRLGPRALLTARVPELLIAWLVEEGARAGRAQADVLSECLRLVREDASLRERLREKLGSR